MGKDNQIGINWYTALLIFSAIPFFYFAFLSAFIAWAEHNYDPTNTNNFVLLNLVIILIMLAIVQRSFNRAFKAD